MDNLELMELMDKSKALNNEEIDRLIKYCKALKKANEIKEGNKVVRKRRVKNSGQ